MKIIPTQQLDLETCNKKMKIFRTKVWSHKQTAAAQTWIRTRLPFRNGAPATATPLRGTLRLDCLAVFPGVAMATAALTGETDTHEHTAASRSGHTTIWLESLSKFGLFGMPYMARAEESLKRPRRAYLPLSLLTYVRLISLRIDAAARSDPTGFAVAVT